MITIRNLTFHYNNTKTPAIKDINFGMKKVEFVFVICPLWLENKWYIPARNNLR